MDKKHGEGPVQMPKWVWQEAPPHSPSPSIFLLAIFAVSKMLKERIHRKIM